MPYPVLDPEALHAEVVALRQALADLSTLDGWTAAGKLASGQDDLSVHRRHHKGVLEGQGMMEYSRDKPQPIQILQQPPVQLARNLSLHPYQKPLISKSRYSCAYSWFDTQSSNGSSNLNSSLRPSAHFNAGSNQQEFLVFLLVNHR